MLTLYPKLGLTTKLSSLESFNSPVVDYAAMGTLLYHARPRDPSTVTVVNDRLTEIRDNNGSGLKIVPYAGINAHQYGSGIRQVQGRNVIDIAGSRMDMLFSATSDLASGAGKTIYFVGNQDTPNSNEFMIGAESNGPDRFWGGTFKGWSLTSTTLTVSPLDSYPHVTCYTRDDTEMTGKYDGVDMTNSPVATTSDDATIESVTLGALNESGSNAVNGYCEDVLIYAGVHDAATQKAIIDSLAYECGVPLPGDDYDVFLLAGQSNMIGFDGDGTVDGPDPRIAQIGRNGSYDERVIIAEQPLAHDGGSPGHIGLGYTFAEKYLLDNPNKKVLLVPTARGSTGLINTADWNKGNTRYDDAIQRVNTAMSYGTGTKTFKGILWHQGENDASQSIPAYEAALDQMFSDMRTDISGASASTPIVVGNLVPDLDAPAMKASIADTPNRVSNLGYVETNDLDDNGDDIHFDAASLRIMGQRYYDAFKVL